MISTVYGAGLYGVEGFKVTVECSCVNRLEAFELVGLPDAAVKESKERIRTAIISSGFEFPDSEITVNMAPADRKKQGSAYDMALLVSILGATGQLEGAPDLSKCCFIGEISLSGAVRSVRGALCMCLSAKAAGLSEIFVPKGNAAEASVAGDGVNVYGVGSVGELVGHLTGKAPITPTVFDKSVFEREKESGGPDFSEVKGQAKVKRALEIAAAGGHNILMIGPPGTGKSMLAKRIPTILPDFTLEEAIDTTKIHSIAGLLPDNVSLVTRRPFRAPHHTLSAVALAGGGAVPMPGEISLAHNGVLFLDELPEFNKDSTEVLRQPLEDGQVTIIRASGRVTYPSSFMLVCAMNPCRCGYYGHPTHPCTCRPKDVKDYLAKASGPLLDRIDIQVEVPPLSFEELSDNTPAESSADIRARVNAARRFACRRFSDAGVHIYSNAEMTSSHIRRWCALDESGSTLLRGAFDTMGLSARGYDRILRVARTIADLDGSNDIRTEHIAEAIQLRSLDRKYW